MAIRVSSQTTDREITAQRDEYLASYKKKSENSPGRKHFTGTMFEPIYNFFFGNPQNLPKTKKKCSKCDKYGEYWCTQAYGTGAFSQVDYYFFECDHLYGVAEWDY